MGIDDKSSHPELCLEVAGGVTRTIVGLFREPEAGNPPVRFDEREQETELCQTGLRRRCKNFVNSHRETNATAPVLDSTPKLVELTDQVLFDDVWERKELSKRDRSLITVAALIALNRPDQLRFHLNYAVQNGLKEEELIEVITHLAFYAGWPSAMSVIMIAKERV